jgi:hypothetical protein
MNASASPTISLYCLTNDSSGSYGGLAYMNE